MLGLIFFVSSFRHVKFRIVLEALGCREDRILLATSMAMQTPDEQSSRPSRRSAISWVTQRGVGWATEDLETPSPRPSPIGWERENRRPRCMLSCRLVSIPLILLGTMLG